MWSFLLACSSGLKALGRRVQQAFALALFALALNGPALAAPFAYITNFNSGDVSVIDTATKAVVATVPVGSIPFGVAVTPNGAFVYVVNEGTATFQ